MARIVGLTQSLRAARKNLATLCLVNKVFCRSVSPWLFRHFKANFVLPRMKTPPLERLRKIYKSPHAKHVCRIDFGFNTYGKPSADDKLDTDNLVRSHSSILAKFTNLRSLHFGDPPLSLIQPQLAAYMDNMVSILRDVPLVNLEDLDICLANRKERERFFPTNGNALHNPIEGFMARLRHLGLTIDAREDALKQKEILESDLAPLDTALLNITDYSPHVFTLLKSARNLKTLALSSAEILNNDDAKFTCPSIHA